MEGNFNHILTTSFKKTMINNFLNAFNSKDSDNKTLNLHFCRIQFFKSDSNNCKCILTSYAKIVNPKLAIKVLSFQIDGR